MRMCFCYNKDVSKETRCYHRKGRRLPSLNQRAVSLFKKGGMAMVSYTELIQFCILIVAIVGLVYKIAHKK